MAQSVLNVMNTAINSVLPKANGATVRVHFVDANFALVKLVQIQKQCQCRKELKILLAIAM